MPPFLNYKFVGVKIFFIFLKKHIAQNWMQEALWQSRCLMLSWIVEYIKNTQVHKVIFVLENIVFFHKNILKYFKMK